MIVRELPVFRRRIEPGSQRMNDPGYLQEWCTDETVEISADVCGVLQAAHKAQKRSQI
jgi:hypothetical protein